MRSHPVIPQWNSITVFGGVPERSNGAVLKTVEGASSPWVRILPPPLFDGLLDMPRVHIRNLGL